MGDPSGMRSTNPGGSGNGSSMMTVWKSLEGCVEWETPVTVMFGVWEHPLIL